MEEQVIIVDKKDNPISIMGKLEAHQKGLLHRAISVFIFNSEGKMLLQRRALHKYHTPGLWSNTACSHPRVGEVTIDAAKRRLKEEMGIYTDLYFSFSFLYKALFKNGLIEHELDHVYLGFSDNKPFFNPLEVCEYRYLSRQELMKELNDNPDSFTPWFKICVQKVLESQFYMQKTVLIA